MVYIIWTPKAADDLEAISNHFQSEAPAYAQTLIAAILRETKRVELFPYSGRIVPEIGKENVREIIFRQYRIVYRVEKQGEDVAVHIATIFHSAQNFKA